MGWLADLLKTLSYRLVILITNRLDRGHGKQDYPITWLGYKQWCVS